MRILALILLLATFAMPIDRPYLHWRIVSVTCDDKGCVANQDVLINTYYLTEAVKQFSLKHPAAEIRCVARDYYYSGCVSR